jgi:hypothetical protein
MAVQDGHGKIATTGLVFAYDVKDTVNSYIGEPTQNLATDSPFRGGWPGSSTLIDSETKTFDFVTSSIEWGGNAAWSTFYYDVSEYRDQYMTISAEVVSFDESNGTFSFMWIGQTINDETYLGYSPAADRNQKTTKTPERISWSGIIGSGGKVGILIWMNNSSGEPGSTRVRFSNIQVELKPHPTVFTPIERSVTQSLIDLTRANEINLSTVSFNSNSQMIFDGTDDTLDTGIPLTDLPALSNFTIECTVKIDEYPTVAPANFYGSTTKAGILIGAAYYSGTALYWYGNSDGSACTIYAYIRGADAYRTAGAFDLIPGQYHHLVLVNDSSGGTIKLYANGTLNGSATTATQEYNPSLAPTAGNIGISKAQVDGGGTQVYSSLPCSVTMAKIYSRALTTAEVLQNYKTVRTKYGIN